MASAYHVKRVTKSGGTRWHVRVSQGRYRPEIFLGAYKTTKERDQRLDWARSELAQGRVPDPHAAPVITEPRTMRIVGDQYAASRRDLADSTLGTFPPRLARIAEHWPTTEPSAITRAEVSAWVDELLARGLGPASVHKHVKLLAQLLDHEDVQPNPARDRRLRLPKIRRTVKRLPTSANIDLVCSRVSPAIADCIRLIEVTGMRIGEARRITWSDIDHERGLIAVQASKTESGVRLVRRLYTTRGRSLVDCTDERLPAMPDHAQPGDRVLTGIGTNASVNVAINKACRQYGLPLWSPHDLRHLQASRLLHAGMSPAELAARLGHASPQITLNTYSHVLPPE